MRLNLNLNKYYDGLDDYQVNTLFGLFINLKSKIMILQKELAEKRTGDYYEYSKDVAFAGFGSIDAFMESMEKETIFDTKNILEKYKTDEEFYNEFDIQPLINKYDFLMSEPEKEKEDGVSKDNTLNKKPTFGEDPGSDGLR